jgi:putative DNA primase/helicase
MPRDIADASCARPCLKVEPGMIDVIVSQAEEAVMRAGLDVYQRGRNLVRPAVQQHTASNGRQTIAACFAEMTPAGVIDYMSQAADWTRFDARAKRHLPIDPPRQVADVLLSRFGAWNFPHVAGIITTPTLRPDHSILSAPGYDPATRLFHAADPTLVLPPIPAFPTGEQAREALDLMDDLLTGFPFVAAVDRVVALSALITPVCRGAVSVAPLHVFRATTAGTGKSYLGDLAAAIVTGRPCPATSAGANDDETDKRLVGLLLSGFSLISLDNVNGELGGDLLAQAVERPTIRLRRLGASDISEIENRSTIFANGNGLRVRGDMTRRSLICDLDAQEERPELRTFDFDPVERVLADRGKYVAAALTIVRAFVVADNKPKMTALASYADYSSTVRGALFWLGRPDPAVTMEQAREDDPELGALRDIMAHWRDRIGMDVDAPARKLIDLADLHKTDPDTGRILPDYANPDLRDALLAVASSKNTIDSHRFGLWLRAKKAAS